MAWPPHSPRMPSTPLDWAPSMSDFAEAISNVSRAPSGCTYVTFGMPSPLRRHMRRCRNRRSSTVYGIRNTDKLQPATDAAVIDSVELNAVGGQVFHQAAARFHDVLGHVLAGSLMFCGPHRSQDLRMICVGVRVPLRNLFQKVARQIHRHLAQRHDEFSRP